MLFWNPVDTKFMPLLHYFQASRIVPGAFAFALLAGCSSTGVVQADRDSFIVGTRDGTPGMGVSMANKARAYQEANDFCRGRGLEVETLNVQVTPSAPLRFGTTELRFRCVQPGLTARPMVRDADQIIELRQR